MLKKFLAWVLVFSALLLGGAENVIERFKNKTFDSASGPKPYDFYGESFAVYTKKAQKYAGKTVAFRATLTRVEGSAVLGGLFRCNTNPGNKLHSRRSFPVGSVENGKPIEYEAVFVVPDVENLFLFNMQIGFRQRGSVHNVWKVENPRFVIPTAAETAAAEKATESKPADSLGGAAIQLNKAPLALVKDGKPLFTIVVPDQSDEIVKYALQELQQHVKLATGQVPSVVRESKFRGGTAIYLGGTKLAQKYSVQPSQLAPESLVVARAGKAILLVGGDRVNLPQHAVAGRSLVAVGTLYAVYEFLESQFGIRWYWPGKIGTVVPNCKNLTVDQLYITSRPDYDTRKTFYSIGKDPRVSSWDFEVWYRRNRFGGSVGDPIANHAFKSWNERFRNTHPEYLSLQADGKRSIDNHYQGHICMSNPDVLKQVIADKLEAYRKNTYSNFSAVMPGDGLTINGCRCSACQKLIQPEKGPSGLYSDCVWGFVNKVAAAIAQQIPGKMVTCCAYSDYERKPSFPLMPNVAVTLCYQWAPRASENYKHGWQALQDEWGSSGARLYVWEYWNNTRGYRGTFGAPSIFPRQLKEIYSMDNPQIHGRAIELCNTESNGKSVNNWADWLYDALNLYTAGKLMWNRSTDVEKLLDEYYTSFFGPAAGVMREFHDSLENRWLLAGPKQGFWDYNQCWFKCYPPEFVDRMMNLLKQAQTLVQGQEPYASRVKWLTEAYQAFDRNSRMFRGTKRPTNEAAITVPRTDEWDKAVVLKNFCDSYNVYAQKSTTEVKMRHDGINLYIRVGCTLPADAAKIRWADAAGKRDAYLWEWESCEFYFASPEVTCQFILAPDHKLADFRHEKKRAGYSLKQAMAWNCPGISFSAQKKGNGWQGELVIPIAELKLSNPLRFNAYHNAHYCLPGDSFKWEQSCYLPVYGNFGNVECFGTLNFG